MALKVEDLMDDSPLPTAWDYLIYPWLQPNRLTLMCGGTDAGKTTLTLEMIAACLKGVPLFGRYPTRQISSVLYLYAEHSIDLVKEIAKLRGDIPKSSVHVIRDYGGFGSNLVQDQRPNVALLNEIKTIADATKPQLIVAEPISAFLATSENDNKEARTLIQVLTALGSRYNAPVLTHHHFGKASFDPEHQRQEGIATGETRGAMAFEDASERVIYIKHEKDLLVKRIVTPKPKGYKVCDIRVKRDEEHLTYTLASEGYTPDVCGLYGFLSAHPVSKALAIPKLASEWRCPVSFVQQLYTRAERLALVTPDGKPIKEKP